MSEIRTPQSRGRHFPVLLALLLVVPALAGCRDAAGPNHLSNLPGVWQWVSSTNVTSGQVHTPATEGYTARLQFVPDRERAGAFVYSRNGTTAVQGRYDIGSEDVPGNDFIVVSSSIDFLTEAAWIGVGSEALRLNGVFELGYNSLYARVHE
jgi:hypothetical protein